MASTDTVKIQPIYTDTSVTPNTTTLGMEERKTLAEFLALAATGATVVGQGSPVITQTAPAAPVFADVAAAQAWCILLRNALIAARVLK
ncbi:hypothetical protein [Edaphovirga cremea]|uniref:hypothetical protein n=1 Tax=Edaphovirga cremea TaxID=2267246 RepID=UPI003989DC29